MWATPYIQQAFNFRPSQVKKFKLFLWTVNISGLQIVNCLIFFAPTAYRNFYQPVLFLILKLHKWKQVKCYIQHVKNTDVKITVNHYGAMDLRQRLLLLVKYVLSIDPSLKDSCAARVQLLFNLWHPKIKHLSPFLLCPILPSPAQPSAQMGVNGSVTQTLTPQLR